MIEPHSISCSSPFSVYLGYIDGNGFHRIQKGTLDHTGSDKEWFCDITLTAPPFTVPAGGWLAFEIVNDGDCLDPLPIGVGGTGMTHGWLKPSNPPTYPTPELSAMVLFGLGLVGVGGYALPKKKRSKSIRT